MKEVIDHYAVLGVPRDADEKAIKTAFALKAREFHPNFAMNDPDANDRMTALNVAHEALILNNRKNPNARAEYDASLQAWEALRDRTVRPFPFTPPEFEEPDEEEEEPDLFAGFRKQHFFSKTEPDLFTTAATEEPPPPTRPSPAPEPEPATPASPPPAADARPTKEDEEELPPPFSPEAEEQAADPKDREWDRREYWFPFTVGKPQLLFWGRKEEEHVQQTLLFTDETNRQVRRWIRIDWLFVSLLSLVVWFVAGSTALSSFSELPNDPLNRIGGGAFLIGLLYLVHRALKVFVPYHLAHIWSFRQYNSITGREPLYRSIRYALEQSIRAGKAAAGAEEEK